MQCLLVAFSLLALASATRTVPQQGKIGEAENQTAPVLLRSAYDRLIKAAAKVEKITGDATLLSKGKRSAAAARALVQDPKMITSDAAQVATQAYAVMGTKPPAPQQKPTNELNTAYHEILAAAEGIELVRRHADTLAPSKVTAFASQMQKDPEKIEKDVEKLEDALNEAEDDVVVAKKDVKEAEAAGEKHDDKHNVTEATAANKAANQALAEADHEQHGGDELLGKVEGDKKQEEKAAAKKADSKKEVEATTAEHKEADAVHAEVDKKDDKHEEKVEKAEEKLEEAKDGREEAIDDHNDHPDRMFIPKKEVKKSSATQLASYAALLTTAMFC